MKAPNHFSLFFFVIFFATITNAQDYRPFSVGNVPFYKDAEDNVRAVRVDSIMTLDNYQIFHFYHEWDFSNYECISPNGPCWIGYQCIWDGSRMTFVNKQNDSLFIDTKKKMNEEWIFCRLSDDSIVYARIIDEFKKNFLGLDDSVKLIALELRDSIGNLISHKLNRIQLELSQSHGFITLISFLEFPDNLMQYSLCGMTEPEIGQTYINERTIYNYDVGDVFHYEFDYSDPPNGSRTFKKEIKRIIDKNVSATGDTITYTCEQILESFSTDYQTFEDSYSLICYTIDESHVFDRSGFLPNELIIDSNLSSILKKQ